MYSLERRPPVPEIPGVQKGTRDLLREKEMRGRITFKEMLQVRERVKGERLPFFVIKDEERNKRISKLWRIPGTSVRISPEGDIYYPVWRERTRIVKPELYLPCSELPKGWSYARLLASARRPISEIVFHQIKKDDGAIEAAIRSMDHVLERYTNKGKELSQVELVKKQIDQALLVLQETKGVSKEEFEEGFHHLYRETLRLMEASGMSRAKLALKKDVDRLLEEASKGKDKVDRRNPQAMLKKLQAAERRVEYRRNEADFIVEKFAVMKEGLIKRRGHDRQILEKAQHELSTGFGSHMYFRFAEEYEGRDPLSQKGHLLGRIGSLIYYLKQVWAKPYKPVANRAIGELKEAEKMVGNKNYEGAKKVLQSVWQETSSVLARFQAIYPQQK